MKKNLTIVWGGPWPPVAPPGSATGSWHNRYQCPAHWAQSAGIGTQFVCPGSQCKSDWNAKYRLELPRLRLCKGLTFPRFRNKAICLGLCHAGECRVSARHPIALEGIWMELDRRPRRMGMDGSSHAWNSREHDDDYTQRSLNLSSSIPLGCGRC